MKSIFLSYLYGTLCPGVGVAGLNIPLSPTGISMYMIGLIVPATAIELIVPPVPEIVTPLIVTSPFCISTS